MGLIQQFLKGFRETDEMEPGLIQKSDGTVWLVNPDGSETQVTGGGGSQPVTVSFPDHGGFPQTYTGLGVTADDEDGHTALVSWWAVSSGFTYTIIGGLIDGDGNLLDGLLVETSAFGDCTISSVVAGENVPVPMIVQPPTSDPGVVGALWNDSGTPAISTG